MLSYLRKKTKSIMIFVAVVFAASMFYGVAMGRGQGGSSGPRGFVKVDGKSIDPVRFNEISSRIIRQFGEEVNIQDLAFIENLSLQQTIDFTLILNQAKKKVRVANREVNLALESVMKGENFKSAKDFETALKRMGMNMASFKKMIKDDLLVQKMITKTRNDVKVLPEDMREISASHILVSNEAEANDLLVKVKAGEDFAALAEQYSKDPGSGKKGGDLGYFGTGMMVEPFEKAAFALKVGEISEVVKSPFGYHIIKVTDSRLRTFTGEEKDLEKAALADKQARAYQKWLAELRENAKIEIIDSALKANDLRFKGRIWEAIPEYKKAIEQQPMNPMLRVYLADTYLMMGQKDKAFEEYEAAINVDGGNPNLYLILAKAYEKAEKKDKAIETYKRASMVAADDKKRHEELRDAFKELKAWPEYQSEQAEIKRIEKKEKFEASLSATPETGN
ncbi:MAG: peptidylprolyl isomerase [bacterium]